MAPTLSSLRVYPVKGCKGIELQSGVVTATGLLFDRNWVIVKESGGRFLTQRQQPKLCLVEQAIVPEPLLQGADLAACPDAKLVLRAPGMPELQVPLATPAASKKPIEVTVWSWTGMAVDEGDEAAQWLSTYLGLPVRLARYAGQPAAVGGAPSGSSYRRPVDEDWAPPGSAAETAFADGFPFLLANEASLEELNRQLAYKGERELPMARFRPNLVVAGARAFAEDGWATLAVGGAGPAGDGGVQFDNVKPCDRCKVTTIDQDTGEEGLEPLVTLREMRSGRALGWGAVPGFNGAVFFATNLVARQQGVVRVGDTVHVVDTRPQLPALPNSMR